MSRVYSRTCTFILYFESKTQLFSEKHYRSQARSALKSEFLRWAFSSVVLHVLYHLNNNNQKKILLACHYQKMSRNEVHIATLHEQTNILTRLHLLSLPLALARVSLCGKDSREEAENKYVFVLFLPLRCGLPCVPNKIAIQSTK